MDDPMNDPMHDSDDILSGSLGRLSRELAPPAALEERTVGALRDAGLLQARSRAGLTLASWVLAASIGAIAFVGGTVMSRSPAANAPQLTFALTLLDGQIDDSAASVTRAAEYDAWAIAANATPKSRSHNGAAIGGRGGIAVNPAIGNSDSVIVDEIVEGPTRIPDTYYISAPTRDSAVKIARNCPHLRYGGRVIVQQLGKP